MTNANHQADERALVSRARQGDADAFGILYTRHLDAIYRYIYYRVGETALAEDLTEDVFVRAWEALPKFKLGKKRPFASWLYRIAHNLVVDTHRKREPDVLPPAKLEAWQSGEEWPEQAVIGQQASAELAWAIQQLGENDQQVIILRFVEGLSHRQVAEITGNSEGASRVAQHRALAKLHDLLADRERHDG